MCFHGNFKSGFEDIDLWMAGNVPNSLGVQIEVCLSLGLVNGTGFGIKFSLRHKGCPILVCCGIKRKVCDFRLKRV